MPRHLDRIASEQTEEEFCRIEGSEGVITLSGRMTTKPEIIKIKHIADNKDETRVFEHPGTGLCFEANAVALDILVGNIESRVMPLAENQKDDQGYGYNTEAWWCILSPRYILVDRPAVTKESGPSYQESSIYLPRRIIDRPMRAQESIFTV